MSASAAGFFRTWTVGRYRVTLTMPKIKGGQLVSCSIEWSPESPRNLSPDEIAEYKRGRDAALLELSAQLGGTVAVLDV